MSCIKTSFRRFPCTICNSIFPLFFNEPGHCFWMGGKGLAILKCRYICLGVNSVRFWSIRRATWDGYVCPLSHRPTFTYQSTFIARDGHSFIINNEMPFVYIFPVLFSQPISSSRMQINWLMESGPAFINQRRCAFRFQKSTRPPIFRNIKSFSW